MLLPLILIFLGLLVQNACSPPEAPAPAKRCDKKSTLTMRTECQSCSVNFAVKCPDGYIKITNGSVGVRDCRYSLGIQYYVLAIPGCRHICRKDYVQPQCCPGHWGPDCMESAQEEQGHHAMAGAFVTKAWKEPEAAPAGAGFHGTACETCAADNVFGPNCSAVCSCVHGMCNSGISGDGTCECLSAYRGPRCDKPIPECATLLCPENSRCSPSSKDETKLQCKCLPGYEGDGQNCTPINPCLKNVCHPHASCSYLGPNQHSCVCQRGYQGDGQVCLPVDPCQTNYGNCPTKSTVCKYDRPGQSHCECKEHYHNFVPGVGCSMTDICESKNPCHKNANCSTVSPGQTQCTCQRGYVGDGLYCYGNIMQRLRELNTEPKGMWQGQLTSFISILEVDVKGLLMDKEAARYFVKLHIIAGQMSTEQMYNLDTFYTLTGKAREIFNKDKDNQLKLKLYGSKIVKIIQGNIVASNGLVHILNGAMDKMEPTLESNPQQTIMTMLQPRYSKFRSLLEKTSVGQALGDGGIGGPYTIFVPSNEALSNMKAGILDYLLSPELEVATLVSTPHVRSMANQIIKFNTTSNGQILANDVVVDETEVAAKNGRIYTLTGVLIPPSILPILPHRCNETKRELKLGTCVSCLLKNWSKCPTDSEPTAIFTHKCFYGSRTRNLKSGCARYCNVTVEIPRCCKGFFGPDCNPCPGGFLNPCSGNGQWKCIDGLGGNGTCLCEDGFQGSMCQFCSNPNRYGPGCNRNVTSQTLSFEFVRSLPDVGSKHQSMLVPVSLVLAWACPCVHGTCDNRLHGDGACLSGTCREGTAGRLCDKQTSACGPFVQFCHVHATCEYGNETASCVCNEGYEGDGTSCSKKDSCLGLTSRGGCSPNAECIRTSTGTYSCVCQRGWTGNGRDCVEINNCLLPSSGGCHNNATCLYVGPGQNECECKKGFRGNGIDCEPVISCLEQTEKCHPLATCQSTSSGVWSCVCQEGYEGNGVLCYGNVLMNASLQSMLSATSNLTVLVPSQQAIEDMDQNEKSFWLTRNNIPALIKYHTLLGTYGVADLQTLSSSHMLATSLQGSFLHLDKAGGNITIEGASFVDGDNAATNGVVHIINKVLVPQRGLTSALPSLLTRLEQMPDYSIFRGYIIQYNLASTIEAADAYTVFVPNNDAIENYIREKKATSLKEDIIRYHVVLGEKLLKNDLHNGMHRETMLGFSYLLTFLLHNDQLYVNEAPINYTNVATDKGVIHGLEKVLEIQKNRCDSNDTIIVRGKCGKCSQYALCPLETKPLTRACCAGFFGPQCQACPGKGQNVCSGNGFCLDGVNGTGTCECGQGFNGTACETCTEGKYGIHCDQACSCVHGRCNQGPSGDGSCDCDVGWRGVKCDSESQQTTAMGPATPVPTAFWIRMVKPRADARRDSGGMEQSAQAAINACEIGNGGCSAKADCKRTTPGSRVCVCKAGYTGDGIVCLEINPCLENNGGCDRHAECTQTGPNQAVCNCLPKYTGDGKACTLINVCLINNGGCSPFAFCNHTEQDQRICTCKPDYTGDGIICRGSIYKELPKNPSTSQFFFQLQEHAVRELAGPGPFTVFAPSSDSFNREPRIKDWDEQGLMSQVLRYHVVACQQLLLENLKVITSATTLQGEPVSISVSQDTVVINNEAKVLSSDIVGTNGVIHVIDKLLSPKNLLITPRAASGRVLQNLTTVAANHGYTIFSKLIQDSGLLRVITDPMHTPVTVFWPTDKALQALPPEQQDFLFNQDNKDKLKAYLKFHVIRDTMALASDLPRSASWKTLKGPELSVRCGTGSDIGELFLNGQMCRITQRGLLFDVGVAYGIDCLLMDPTLGGRCDTFTTFNIMVHGESRGQPEGECGSCITTPRCPLKSKPKGVRKKCIYKPLSFGRNMEGCQNLCTLIVSIPMCCKGYFLPDCQACPGGPDTPCNNRGMCHDLYRPMGQCECHVGFNGTACELCWSGRFGPDCQPCGCSEHGQCDEGITGSGQCLCEAGWTGRFCDAPTVVIPVCIPACSEHATCMENNTCVCNLNYEGDGITCKVVDFCKQNNGGCAKVAKCSQKGTQVSCSCQKGYKGDGHSCTEIDPCADGVNGGCHEHATCSMTGPGKNKCECKSHYVGDGRDCEPEQLPLDRCLQDNGQCHPDASCADLHFQDTTVGVFHLRSPLGQYKLTFDKAKEACANEAASIATYNQLSYAQKAKYHLCSAGWLESGRVAYPTTYASQKCGANVVGIVDYGTRSNKSEMWDVFCYRMKDVNCTCKAGYVGDGFSCSGNLLQVLMSIPSLTNFLTEVLAFSKSSARGRAFLKHLTDLSISGTLFVPQNSGLPENKSLSGRDIEHHLANVNVSFYDDLVNGTILRTRLGSQLLITSSQDQLHQETRFVDGRAILQWDIIASNGILHIISDPLKAPPTAATAAHSGLGTGIFCAVVLVAGVIALAAYSYFRLNQRTAGFRRFESEDDIDVLAFGKQQPESIANPLYETSTPAPPEASRDPFTDSGEQEPENSDPLGALRS
ncbi:Stabilin-2 [Apodemus speciosus]|uniref:Stabilin-2 n=1 Tax=Apodemus speciosus TaxID=105296 RepID=A0ABQ0F8I2_APOSI